MRWRLTLSLIGSLFLGWMLGTGVLGQPPVPGAAPLPQPEQVRPHPALTEDIEADWRQHQIAYAEARLRLAEARLRITEETNERLKNLVTQRKVIKYKRLADGARWRLEQVKAGNDEHSAALMEHAVANAEIARDDYRSAMEANQLSPRTVPVAQITLLRNELELAEARLAMVRQLPNLPQAKQQCWYLDQVLDSLQDLRLETSRLRRRE
ncbi:Hypothetical protein PBC10988_29870 [Planctomycetales bacterium 10988]|nr:Hypothetical protein PBC10988_29870 [Planctomycetales bacterium 10988]